MRDIKFRSWSEQEKEMYHWEKNHLPMLVRKHIHMQFTGLLDKNAKEIYEGDVVEMDLGKYVVKFCEGSFRLCESKYPSGFLIGDCSSKMYEVIGNIYENPELVDKSP